MKNIELIGNFGFNALPLTEKKREVREIYKGSRRQILEVRLNGGAVLPKHKAAEPITVFCLSGKGTFRAGRDLEDAQILTAGTLVTLEPNVEHEAVGEPDLHLLVTKFKENATPQNESSNVKELVQNLRHDFTKAALEKSSALADPIDQFGAWIGEAAEKKLHEPNAMTLSTATPGGSPSSRIVLLRGFDREGFTFFTNYDSRKGAEISANPTAALLFYWAEIEKQVRIEGSIEKAPPEISDAYFASRPRESRVGAWASPQSQMIENRLILEQKYAELNEQFAESEIDRPSNWGGYILKPERFEFWQGRASRLHDRLLYRKNGTAWDIVRLAP